MQLDLAHYSQKGKRHEENEDSLLMREEASLFAVADGMSQPHHGKRASQLALEALASYLQLLTEKENAAPSCGLIEEAVQAANYAVFHDAMRNPEQVGMGTTLTVALFNENEFYLAHVGDSRAYLLSGTSLRRLTQDDVLIRGNRRSLSNWVGLDRPIEVQTAEMGLRAGDILLLLTDGFFEFLSEAELSLMIKAPNRWNAESLIGHLGFQAQAQGAGDDCSAIAVAVRGPIPA